LIKTETRNKNNLPKGVGMQIRVYSEWDFHENKQRYRLEFLLNRELTDNELMILSFNIEDIEKVNKTKQHQFWKLIFDGLNQSFVSYVAFVVADKEDDKEDIKDELQDEIESLSGSLKFLGCDLYKIKKFPYEKEKKVINISEKALLDKLNISGFEPERRR